MAARILPSSHTNPIFVVVGSKPIRAFRRSVEWCLESVEQCWRNKERFISEKEMEGAKESDPPPPPPRLTCCLLTADGVCRDYEHARKVYRERLKECEVDGPETTGAL